MSKFSLMPRDDKFFDLFEAGVTNMVRAAESLKEMICNWENIDHEALLTCAKMWRMCWKA